MKKYKNISVVIRKEQYFSGSEKNRKKVLGLTYHSKNQIKSMWSTKELWPVGDSHWQTIKLPTKNVMIRLINRAIILCNPEFTEAAIEKARYAIKLNHYPKQLVSEILKTAFTNYIMTTHNTTTT